MKAGTPEAIVLCKFCNMGRLAVSARDRSRGINMELQQHMTSRAQEREKLM